MKRIKPETIIYPLLAMSAVLPPGTSSDDRSPSSTIVAIGDAMSGAASSPEISQTPAKRSFGTPFQPGQSGNPSGKPKGTGEVTELARTFTRQAMATLISIARDERKPAAARVSAAVAILDRGWGKPTERQQLLDENGKPIRPGTTIVIAVAGKEGAIGPVVEHAPAEKLVAALDAEVG